jgi:hypothetical protein
VLGTTVVTAATVLACYFAGLGLGSAWARRVSPRPVRLYGFFEVGAAAGALWSLAVFYVLQQENVQSWLFTAGIDSDRLSQIRRRAERLCSLHCHLPGGLEVRRVGGRAAGGAARQEGQKAPVGRQAWHACAEIADSV